MRLIAVFLFSTCILGGMWSYIRFTDSIAPPPINLIEADANDHYSIDITLTFDAGVDPFAGIEMASLRVSFRDKTLLNSSDSIAAGTPIRIENIEDIKAGKNEFLVFASPGIKDNDILTRSRALRIRIFKGNQIEPIVQKTIWTEQASLQGRIALFVDDDTTSEVHSH